jgi:lipoyl synthase
LRKNWRRRLVRSKIEVKAKQNSLSNEFPWPTQHVEEQLWEALRELRKVDVDVVTFGQYMRPTKRHMAVYEYVTPDVFEMWRVRALEMGFLYVASGPLVRSSYKAGEAFIENVLKKRRAGRTETATADITGDIASKTASV